ncbi:MAG: HDIG domain-containing protein [Ardenticatenaceae bacterium]|nr:HDIG domain-containing protein [Ardenticatenaceae bacterium]
MPSLTRTDAWTLVCAFTDSESLRRHMLAVEAAMRAYAPRFGGDPDLWGAAGLLHDFDYERYPNVAVEGHPVVGSRVLREQGWPDEVIRAILAHASEITGVEPETPMERALVAVDELTGFIIAVALVRPSASILDVRLKSIKKKWKDKAFAAAVNRHEIEEAAAALGVPLDEHIRVVLGAMQAAADDLGLRGAVSEDEP